MRCTRSLALPLVVLLSVGPLQAQQEVPGRDPGTTDQPVFRAGVDLVTVTASVRDRRGRVVRDLAKADFTVIDTGEPREIRDFFSGEAPISLAILLDISGSMAVGGNMDRARDAVWMATTSLRAESDEAALFTFDSELRQAVSFTDDLSRMHRVSLAGKPWGKTSLYDAVAQAATVVAQRPSRHRALFVITDGVDTGSQLSAPEVSGLASAIAVPVYLLTVVTPIDHPGTRYEVASDGRAAQTATLEDLARWTGGDMRIASTPAHISVAVQDLFTELRHQYVISFDPGERPGWHTLEIRTRKGSHTVRARGGYMSGPSRGSS